MIVLITPTADRPAGIALCEKWMARQTLKWDRWVIADGGQEKCIPTLGQEHVATRPQANGGDSLCCNLIAAVERIGKLSADDAVMIVEDDDYYPRDYIECAADSLKGHLIAGQRWAYYYNLQVRGWLRMENPASAPLCATVIRGDHLMALSDAAHKCLTHGSHNVDGTLWRSFENKSGLHEIPMVVGIKGLQGKTGLGIGHDTRRRWNSDPDGSMLRHLVGADAKDYQ